MVVVVGQLVQEGTRLQNERRKYHFGKIHSGSYLLHQKPNETFVIIGELFDLLTRLQKRNKII